MVDRFLHDINWVLPLRNDGLTPVFETFTWLGYPTFITFFLPLLYWAWNRDAATRVMMIVMLSSLLNAFLKDYWMNPRPDIALQLDPEVAQSFGMPSGHAQVSGVLWLWLAYELKRLWVWLGALFIVSMICLSRLYLGVHDLEDIIVGLVLAVVSMLLFRLFLSPLLQRFRGLNATWHIFFILMLMMLLALIWPGLSSEISQNNRAQSYDTLLVCALMMGWLYGRQWDQHYVDGRLRINLWGQQYLPQIIAGLFGIISLFLLNIVLRTSLTFMDELSGNFLILLLLGFYMTFGVPLLLKILRLAR